MDLILCIKTFHEVVKQKSFGKAAKNLHATQPAISKRVSLLEKSVGAQLIQRTSRELTLTRAGEVFHSLTKDWLDDWSKIQNMFTNPGQQPSGNLRVAAAITTSDRILMPHMVEFMHRHPIINMNFRLYDRLVDIINDPVDLFIAPWEMSTSKIVVCETLTTLETAVVAAPKYLEKNLPIKKLEDIAKHNCLITDFYQNEFPWDTKNPKIPITGNFSSNSFLFVIRATIDGLGLAVLPLQFIRQELADGKLVIVCDSELKHDMHLYAYYLETNKSFPALRTYLDFVKETIQRGSANSS